MCSEIDKFKKFLCDYERQLDRVSHFNPAGIALTAFLSEKGQRIHRMTATCKYDIIYRILLLDV